MDKTGSGYDAVASFYEASDIIKTEDFFNIVVLLWFVYCILSSKKNLAEFLLSYRSSSDIESYSLLVGNSDVKSVI